VDFSKLPVFSKGRHLHVVVEAPRGSNVKLKHDPDLGVFVASRSLVLGTSYPHDWGFVPSTKAADGDPLDAMVLSDAATYPGVVLECRPLALLKVTQKGKAGKRERNDRVIAAAVHCARMGRLHKLADLEKRTRDEIEQFFKTAVVFEDKALTILGWGNEGAAMRAVKDAMVSRSGAKAAST
jgi:inorganic pyrophosphatase